jgi:aminoglycoside phosphotransferase (APT) family kinase protein
MTGDGTRMTAPPGAASLGRYYEVLLATLDREIEPELHSERAKFLYGATRRILARLCVANDATPTLPENLAATAAVSTAPSAEAATRATLESEGERLDSIEAAVELRLSARAHEAGAAGAQQPITADRVQAYLRERLDPDVRVTAFKILAGGRSKQTIMLSLTDVGGKTLERVIRRDLVVAITGATVVDEYRVLVALADRGYPVPRPHWLETDTSWLGSAFMVMDKVEGRLAGDVFDAPESRECVLRSATVLGELHSLPAAELAPTLRPAMQSALDRPQLRHLVLELQRTWATSSRAACIAMDAVFTWLLDNVERVQPLTSVVHGDYSYHNILFEQGALSAVMDWELVRIGHPAEDLGYIRAAVLNRVDWEDFMAAYRAGGGADVQHRDVVFFCLLSKLRLLTLLFGARQYFESGATDDLQLADVSIFHLPRLIQQASAEIRAVLAHPPAP